MDLQNESQQSEDEKALIFPAGRNRIERGNLDHKPDFHRPQPMAGSPLGERAASYPWTLPFSRIPRRLLPRTGSFLVHYLAQESRLFSLNGV